MERWDDDETNTVWSRDEMVRVDLKAEGCLVQAAQHELDHGEVDERLGGVGEIFEVSGQPAVSAIQARVRSTIQRWPGRRSRQCARSA